MTTRPITAARTTAWALTLVTAFRIISSSWISISISCELSSRNCTRLKPLAITARNHPPPKQATTSDQAWFYPMAQRCFPLARFQRLMLQIQQPTPRLTHPPRPRSRNRTRFQLRLLQRLAGQIEPPFDCVLQPSLFSQHRGLTARSN